MIKIILADDHQILREALRLLLSTQEDLVVLAETGSGQDALALVEKHHPDVLIVDLMMPGLPGLDVARAVKHFAEQTHVIVLSMHDTESYVVEALRAGVAGYVLKKNSTQELIFAIHQAMEGNLYLSPSLNRSAIQSYTERSQESPTTSQYEQLTQREREIFHLAVEGLSNPQIAVRLSLSARTVEMHRANLMKKLGLHTQIELIIYAVKHHLA